MLQIQNTTRLRFEKQRKQIVNVVLGSNYLAHVESTLQIQVETRMHLSPWSRSLKCQARSWRLRSPLETILYHSDCIEIFCLEV